MGNELQAFKAIVKIGTSDYCITYIIIAKDWKEANELANKHIVLQRYENTIIQSIELKHLTNDVLIGESK